MNVFRIASGASGAVRWGYHVAARIGRWTISEDGQTVVGALEAHAEMVCAQSPLVFVVDAGKGQWRWPVRDLTVTGATVTLTVGPREGSHGQLVRETADDTA